MRSFLLIPTLMLLAGLVIPSGATAQDVGECRQVRPGRIECSPVRVVGRTPGSFYLLSRSRVRYEPPPLRRELVGEVRRSVRRGPF